MLANSIPRVMICGLRGGSGKTLVALGLARALYERGSRVIPFKKGPDYIDAAWHSLATGVPCRNLDTFLMGPEQVLRTFLRASHPHAISLIEGNRGLFDGMDLSGTHSTAHLAKLLKCPVILVVDCTKSTRTVAAAVLGCKAFDPDLPLAGVVLNRVAGLRHEKMVRGAIEHFTGEKVLGALPQLRESHLGERHLGLLPPTEHANPERAIELARSLVEEHVDLGSVQAIATAAEPLHFFEEPAIATSASVGKKPRIGIIRDSAFSFYYPENLEQLEQRGAELVILNALNDPQLPSIDGLYIGGGFPETHAARLSANEGFLRSLRLRIGRGLPVYAECGGLVYLSEAIVVGREIHPMAGVFPVMFEMASKPQGHGYTIMQVDQSNPFFEIGTTIRGHEFRYSRILDCEPKLLRTVFRMGRGTGFDGARDGLCYKNVLAAFCHIHASGLKCWAEALVKRALEFRRPFDGEKAVCDEAPRPLVEEGLAGVEPMRLDSNQGPLAIGKELARTLLSP